MPKKRARLTDENDPLSSTDEVLAGLQQLSQSTSQPDDSRESNQQLSQSTSQPVDSLTSQNERESNPSANLSARQEDDKSTRQPDNQTLSQGKQTNNPSASQQSNLLTSKPDSADANLTNRQPVNLSTSEPDNPSTLSSVKPPKLRKVTFQIQESVVHELDQLHLQLQLELGKANAPYKEVMVEEAIAQLLIEASQNRDNLIKTLQKRQNQRR